MALLPKVEAFVRQHGLLQPGHHVLVAVSGGPDSVALGHLLIRMGTDWPLTVSVAHVDHGLRPDSHADAAFVGRLGDEWGVPVHVVQVDVGGRRRGGESIQQAARRLRLQALRDAAQQVGATAIALGHHQDDQAETVLLRLLRGSGPTGLGGMRPKRGPFIRPLLDVARAEIEQYCHEHGLRVVHDPSNVSELYVRNRVRRRLLPLLKAEYNPNIAARLARTAALLHADDELLESLAAQAMARCRVTTPGKQGQGGPAPGPAPGSGAERRVHLSVEALREQPAALRRRIVRRALQEAGADLRRVTADHTDAAVALVEDPQAGAMTVPGNLRVERIGDVLVIGRGGLDAADGAAAPGAGLGRPSHRAVTLSEKPREQQLHVPGRTALGGAVLFEATFTAPDGVLGEAVRAEARFDHDRLALPLFIRSRAPGDRMRPVGMGGTKKLQDIFVDEKVPRPVRDRVPIIHDQRGVLWIPGLKIDERAAAGEEARNILYVRIVSL